MEDGLTKPVADEVNDVVPQDQNDQSRFEQFLLHQSETLAQFLEQQNQYLEKLGFKTAPTGQPARKRPHQEKDDVVSLHAEDSSYDNASTSEEDDDADKTDDLLLTYSKGLHGKGVPVGSGDDDDIEHIEGSRYRDLLEQTEEKMGDPIEDEALASVCSKIWGKVNLSKDKKKAIQFKDILIPENCKAMKTPRLNTEVYLKIIENAQTKDRAAQDRQKDLSKAAIPLLKAMAEIRNVETLMEKSRKKAEEAGKTVSKTEKEAYERLQGISPIIQKSVKVLNYSYTNTMRKRKSDVCNALGDQFRPFATSTSSEDFLFDNESIKKMKSELKLLKTRSRTNKAKPYQPSKFEYSGYSKNYRSSGKSSKSYPQGNRSFNNNRNFNYNNNNHNNNNKPKFNKK